MGRVVELTDHVTSAWVQWIIGAAALSAACIYLWRQVLHPLLKAALLTEQMLPLLREVTDVFKDNPSAFAVLGEIAEQFGTNSGSSLRDAVDRLEAATTATTNQIETLRINAATTKELAELDRRQVERLGLLLDRLDVKVSGVADVGHRVEESGIRVEADRAVVAQDLAAAKSRAEESVGEPGAAADAAALPLETPLPPSPPPADPDDRSDEPKEPN